MAISTYQGEDLDNKTVLVPSALPLRVDLTAHGGHSAIIYKKNRDVTAFRKTNILLSEKMCDHLTSSSSPFLCTTAAQILVACSN
jgi:hypothetical protein